MAEALLILFGFALGSLPSWLDRRRKLRAHWAALRAELQLCHERATALLKDAVAAPLYRLPLSAYEVSFSVLLGEGALSENEALNVGRFCAQAQDINRGLDNATAMVHSNDSEGLQREYQRNLLKAKTLIEEEESLYALASRVVNEKLARPWWRY